MSRTVRMSVHFATAALGLWLASMDAASAQDSVKKYQIAEQSLGQALREFALAGNLDLLFSPDLVAGKKSSSLDGKFTVDEGLRTLLRGSGLEFSVSGSRIVINEAKSAPARQANAPTTSATTGTNGYTRLAQAETGSTSTAAVSEETSEPSSQRRIELQEILVTGTHIRGAEVVSPVVTITQEDMRRAGHNNLGDVIRALPQNFVGGHPGVQGGATAGGLANQNVTGSSSLNLRGLGPDATLTLLNGTRLPYDGFVQATDISVVPVAAIERFEVLLDGGSAIYGSDAVGGVANIILKRDYQGAELSARYGVSTDGGNEQQQYTGVAGHVWGSGGLLFTADYSTNTSVRARDRDYLGYLPLQAVETYPETEQTGLLVSGHQELGTFAELSLDAFHTERTNEFLSQTSPTRTTSTALQAEIWGLAPRLRFDLPGDWNLQFTGVLGRNDADFHAPIRSIATGALVTDQHSSRHNKVDAAGVEMEGPLFDLPGGEARLFVGGGYRRNVFESRNVLTGTIPISGSDRSQYAYGEANLPLISDDQGISFIKRLSFNGALRYEDYESFGDTTTPKLGVIWTVTEGLDLRANWGRSFKVPQLAQQFSLPSVDLLPDFFLPGLPAGRTVLFGGGGNPALSPERAEIVTAGFTARPDFLEGFKLDFSWFDIDYTDRVVNPINPLGEALTNPAFAAFVTLNPTIAQQNAVIAPAVAVGRFFNNFGAPTDPALVYAIVHAELANSASQRTRGVDLTARYETDAFGGQLSLSGNASWITTGSRKLTTLSPELQTVGVNYFPPKFKGRVGASWSRDSVTLSTNLNYIDGVKNTTIATNPSGDSMTTLDLVVGYEFASDAIGELGINLGVTNVFNEAPPFLQPSLPYQVNYDSTNYSAIGRVISASVVKRF